MAHLVRARVAALTIAAVVASLVAHGQSTEQEGFRFRSGIDLVNVTVTVTDRSGRFVPSLGQTDFTVFEDDQPVEVTHFSADRVPVSLGLVLDTSGSMAGDKIERARAAVERFVNELRDPQDEVFIYGFSSEVRLLQEWTNDREAVRASLRRVQAVGGTAMYDAVIAAVPKVQDGQNRKKAVVLISDGNDTSSERSLPEVRRIVRESDVLVYAIGLDAEQPAMRMQSPPLPPVPIPFPVPGPGRPRPRWPGLSQLPRIFGSGPGNGLNAQALRDITEDSGGRTEVVRNGRDLGPATLRIADELSRQYFIGYTSPSHRDGRWHSIRVEARDRSLRIRARRGYLAS